MRTNRIIAIILVLLTILFSACDYTEIEDMPMIVGVAIDKDGEDFILSAKVVVPIDESGGGTSSNQMLIQTTGKTIFDAVRDFIIKEGEKVFWGQLEFMIINYELAKSGELYEVLDFFYRDPEVREDTHIVVTEEGRTASETLIASVSEQLVVVYIMDALSNAKFVGKYDPVTLVDFVKTSLDKGCEPILPKVSIVESLDKELVVVAGGYLFKDGKIVGEIDGASMQLYRMLRGKGGIGILVVDYEDGGERTKISIEVDKSNSDMKITRKDGQINVQYSINFSGSIGEVTNNDVIVTTHESNEKFKRYVEKELESKMYDLIRFIQINYGTDVLDIGEQFKNKYPKQFKKYEDSWNQVFTTVNICVDVQFAINNLGMHKQTLKKGD